MMRSRFLLPIGIGFLLSNLPYSSVADDQAKELPSVMQRRARTAIMVHRGSLDLAVENTLAAIEASFLTGADGVEIDIAQTSDGTIVLMHDPWIDRVLRGFGNVAELSYEELLTMRFRDPYGLTRSAEHTPTLRDTLELIKRYNGLIHLDIKVPNIDDRVHEMLVQLDLIPNVVTVNAYNSERVRADPRIRVLPSQGALIHGNNDYDAKAVQAHLDREPKGTFLVDDARCAATLLDRPTIADIKNITLAHPLPRTLALADAKEISDPANWIRRLDQSPPVQQFADNEKQSRDDAASIRRRAVLARALLGLELANATLPQTLERMMAERSLHLNGAWQGLDGAEAVKTLAEMRPDERTVQQLVKTVLYVDPSLKVIEKREELPTWLRQSGTWWDFRIKTEAIAALGKIGGSMAQAALWEMLEQPQAQAESIWRELHWDAARALTAGSWQLTPHDLRRLLNHKTSGVRRAGCVYLVHHQHRPEYRSLIHDYLPWLEVHLAGASASS